MTNVKAIQGVTQKSTDKDLKAPFRNGVLPEPESGYFNRPYADLLFHDPKNYNVAKHIKGPNKTWNRFIKDPWICGPIMHLFVRSLQYYKDALDFLPEKIEAYSDGGYTKHILVIETKHPDPWTEKKRRDEVDAIARRMNPYYKPKELGFINKVMQKLCLFFYRSNSYEFEAAEVYSKLPPEAEDIKERNAKRMLLDPETRMRGFRAGGLDHNKFDPTESKAKDAIMSFELFDRLLFYNFVEPSYTEFFRRGIRYMIASPWHVTNRDVYWGKQLLLWYEGVSYFPEEPIETFPYDKWQMSEHEIFRRMSCILSQFRKLGWNNPPKEFEEFETCKIS